MINLAGQKCHPGRTRLSRNLKRRLDRFKNKKMRRMPVFSAASVRNQQIDLIKIETYLRGKVFRRNVGCIRFDTSTERVDVAKEDQFIHSEDPAGAGHLLRTHRSQRLA